MIPNIEKWKTQIRRGYLELCILLVIQSKIKTYGFEILEVLKDNDLEVKEGTLYPLLNRMAQEGTLSSHWITENNTGHPRKFYALTPHGEKNLEEMKLEFHRVHKTYKQLNA